ncbi:uncharacterized protein A1O5_08297 [Cladophialophora psammophila CBS 110553]|uniref:Uncharacterized protein n=1 Tax=Cladophialophora psammophila CBS 110553 TaxID=1182543 RepID=W9XDK9_9EURO|nr:uncharacterized protein A1O5_08297 [Cladophialophora psammophila CBS 110553]EXJ68504.1 hypothetical protein A1O5_08297 [Cladophialophora psammophila CBS 110553]
MGDEKLFRDLQLSKDRYEQAGYIISSIPISEDHQRWLAEKAALSQQSTSSGAGQTNSSCDTSISRQTGPLRNHHSSSDSQSSWTSDNSKTSGPTDTGEPLAVNELLISLCFENEDHFESKVLLDSGSEHNWISNSIIKKRRIPQQHDHDGDQIYMDFSNRELRSLGVVKAQWMFNDALIPVKFKIAPDPPVEVCFGYRFLLEKELVRFFHSGAVAGLVKGKRKANSEEKAAIQQKERTIDSLNDKIKDFLSWKKKMEERGWEWDKNANNFFRTQGNTKVWNQAGYLLDLRTDDLLRNSPQRADNA